MFKKDETSVQETDVDRTIRDINYALDFLKEQDVDSATVVLERAVKFASNIKTPTTASTEEVEKKPVVNVRPKDVHTSYEAPVDLTEKVPGHHHGFDYDEKGNITAGCGITRKCPQSTDPAMRAIPIRIERIGGLGGGYRVHQGRSYTLATTKLGALYQAKKLAKQHREWLIRRDDKQRGEVRYF